MTETTTDWKPKLARKARLRWDAMTERFVLLLPEAAIILRGNAPDIIQLCDGTRTVSALIDELAAKYSGGAREPIEADVRDFLERFRAKALLEDEP
jgi:pyrroloquinoline quinone biosynthesis protein D